MPVNDNQSSDTAGVEGMKKRIRQILMDNLLIILIVIAVFIGVALGLGLRSVWSYEDFRKVWYLEFPGRLLLNMLKMLILPLMVSSVVASLASIGPHSTGKLGAAAVAYYMTTTLIAIIIGIILVLTIHPGSLGDRRRLRREESFSDVHPLDSILDVISQCFPDNLVTAAFKRPITKITLMESDPRVNKTDGTKYTVMLKKYGQTFAEGTNMLGIIVYSIALGLVIHHLGDQGEPLKNIFAAINAATMVLVNVFIWYTPVGVVFLIASKFAGTKNIGHVLRDLGKYMCTVLGGLFVHGCIVLPLIYLGTTRKSPGRFAKNMAKALFTAWGTASSSATLPLTMDCLVNNNKINVNVVRFVAPLGATINMDGTALYEAVACIFIAQTWGMNLSVTDVFIVSVTATAAAIGAAGIPQAGLVTLVMVLTSVGLPTEDVIFILSLDWFLDRFRTAVNVWGDSVGAGILDHFFKDIFDIKSDENDVDLVAKKDNQISSGKSKNSFLLRKSHSKQDTEDGETSTFIEL